MRKRADTDEGEDGDDGDDGGASDDGNRRRAFSRPLRRRRAPRPSRGSSFHEVSSRRNGLVTVLGRPKRKRTDRPRVRSRATSSRAKLYSAAI